MKERGKDRASRHNKKNYCTALTAAWRLVQFLVSARSEPDMPDRKVGGMGKVGCLKCREGGP